MEKPETSLTSGGRKPADRGSWPWLVAAAGTACEAGTLLLLALLSAYGVVSGGASTTTRALTEAAVLIILAVGVGLLARNLVARRSLAKTPTLLWNFMLMPVSVSLMTGGAPVWGGVVLLFAVVTFVAALLVPSFDLTDDDDVVL